ncbi:MAG: hypothetical protein NUV50_00195 [Rhodospirillales bacterium]|nr:hypothetical protein [Rhodospirillales bacterium]
MSIDSVTSSSAAAYISDRARTDSAAKQENSSSSTAQGAILDTVELSPKARKFIENGSVSSIASRVPSEVAAALKMNLQDGLEHMRYDQEKGQFIGENMTKVREVIEKWNKESGGLFYGTGFSLENSSKPITTTSGKVHPKSELIRSFLQGHQREVDQLKTLQEQKFMSFEEWKANNG